MTKRVIYEPAQDEIVPDGGVFYRLPVAGVDVVDVLVPDDWGTAGTVHYNSLSGKPLAEQHIHHFAGWEV